MPRSFDSELVCERARHHDGDVAIVMPRSFDSELVCVQNPTSRPSPPNRSPPPNPNSSRLRWSRATPPRRTQTRSEEHTSELQSPCNLVCRLLLEKKKNACTINDALSDSLRSTLAASHYHPASALRSYPFTGSSPLRRYAPMNKRARNRGSKSHAR